MTVLRFQRTDFALQNGQPRLPLDRGFDAFVVAALVHLRPQRMHGRTFSGIEHAHLNQRIIGGETHFSAERIELTNEMSLARSADRGVAGHHADAVKIQRQQQGIQPHTRSGERRLYAGVACADHDNVKRLVLHKFLLWPNSSVDISSIIE